MAGWPSRGGQEAIKTIGVVNPVTEGPGNLGEHVTFSAAIAYQENEGYFSPSSSLSLCLLISQISAQAPMSDLSSLLKQTL